MLRTLLFITVMVAAAQEPRPLLEIDAIAVDRKGRPVTDLEAEDLEVWISGYRIPVQSISLVTPSSEERSTRLIVLILDDVTTEPGMVLRVRETARQFVARMRPGDRMGVVPLSGRAMEITSEPERLRRWIDTYSNTAALVTIDRLGAQVLNTIAAVSRDMSEAPERRKTIVAIGSGGIFDRPIPPPQLGQEVRREWLDAVRAMAVANARFYIVDPAGVGTRPSDGRSGFAREAGGHAFLNTNDTAGAVDQILRETRTNYVIRVEDPPVGRNASMRELDVRSRRRDVSIRVRRGILGHGQIR